MLQRNRRIRLLRICVVDRERQCRIQMADGKLDRNHDIRLIQLAHLHDREGRDRNVRQVRQGNLNIDLRDAPSIEVHGGGVHPDHELSSLNVLGLELHQRP